MDASHTLRAVYATPAAARGDAGALIANYDVANHDSRADDWAARARCSRSRPPT